MEPDIERVILRNEDGTEYRDRDGQLVFTEVDISPKRDKALDYSIGDILGFHPATQIPYWWGKIRYRVESESWVALPDSDNFKISKPTLVEGQWIIINPNYRTRINKIVSRHDDNSYSVLLEDISGISLNTDYLFHSGYNVSNIPPIKNSAMYTVLSIPSIYRNRSNNKNIHKIQFPSSMLVFHLIYLLYNLSSIFSNVTFISSTSFCVSMIVLRII